MSPQPRGFALLTPEQRRALSSMGGRASVAKGIGHRFTVAEAAKAGRKGGKAKRKGNLETYLELEALAIAAKSEDEAENFRTKADRVWYRLTEDEIAKLDART